MSTTTNLTTLKINYLTQDQYDAAYIADTLEANEIYMTPAKDAVINLFEPTFWGKTLNQVTYTFNYADKTYAVSGTASANTSPTLGVITLPAGTYKLLGLQDAGSSSTFRLNLYNMDNNPISLIAQDKGSGAVFTLPSETNCDMRLYINSGVSVNLTVKPMITKTVTASKSDYVPHLYEPDTLIRNVSDLKNDLYASKFTGDKTRNSNVGWLDTVAQSWQSHNSDLWYDYEDNLFWNAVVKTDNKYPISCSIFVSIMIFGITWENSKYAGNATNTQNAYSYKDDTLLELLKGNFQSEYMLPYFIEKGYAFKPTSNLSNCQVGDILYYDLDPDNNNYLKFMGVDHSAVYMGEANSTQYYVWEVGGNNLVEYRAIPYSARDCLYAVRVPFKTPHPLQGTTAERPTDPIVGMMYFDSTLSKPIWFTGSVWVDATGTTV